MDKIEKLINEIESVRKWISTDTLNMSFGEILSMHENREIIIAPDLQKSFLWPQVQQTRFIESLLLGIPIPPIIVTESETGQWELLDGFQRVLTFITFFGKLTYMPEKNNWLLCEGDLIKSLNHLGCKDLPLKLQLHLKRSVCGIVIINWDGPDDTRDNLFKRLDRYDSDCSD